MTEYKNYISAFEDVAPPPPSYVEAATTTQTVTSDSTIGLVVVSANLAVTIIIIAFMSVYGSDTLYALKVGAAYFGLSTPLYILIITGALTSMVNVTQHEVTERQRIAAYKEVMLAGFEWRIAVEQNRNAELQAQAMPLQLTRRIAALETELLEQRVRTPSTQPPTFVTAYDNTSGAAFADEEPQVDSTAQEAVTWLSGLYNDLGMPDAKKLQLVGDTASLGRLRVRMLGSKRGQGSREAGLWLLNQGVVKKVAGGYMLMLAHYPTRESLRNLL